MEREKPSIAGSDNDIVESGNPGSSMEASTSHSEGAGMVTDTVESGNPGSSTEAPTNHSGGAGAAHSRYCADYGYDPESTPQEIADAELDADLELEFFESTFLFEMSTLEFALDKLKKEAALVFRARRGLLDRGDAYTGEGIGQLAGNARTARRIVLEQRKAFLDAATGTDADREALSKFMTSTEISEIFSGGNRRFQAYRARELEGVRKMFDEPAIRKRKTE